MYADEVTGSMERAITETMRRREIQMRYNEEHGIVPKTIHKNVHEILEISSKAPDAGKGKGKGKKQKKLSREEKQELIKKLTAEMKNAAKLLEFEHAIYLRDRIEEIKNS